jgi:hypothetical protein
LSVSLLPPLEDQESGYLRLLVYRREDDDAAIDAVPEKTKTGALIRMAQQPWTGYVALIPSDVKQVVLLVSGVTGMAPMLQTLHTLLEERRGDGMGEKELRRLELHVVWFKQNLESVDEHGMSSPYAPSTSLEISTACAELERLSKLHLNKLVVEPVDTRWAL